MHGRSIDRRLNDIIVRGCGPESQASSVYNIQPKNEHAVGANANVFISESIPQTFSD
jgi:hypothetical protein